MWYDMILIAQYRGQRPNYNVNVGSILYPSMIFRKTFFSYNFFTCWNANTLEYIGVKLPPVAQKLFPQGLIEVDAVVISITNEST